MAGVNVPLLSVAAPVPGHRADRRAAAQPADAARSGPADLLQGGGRRPGDGRLRAEPDPLGGGRHPEGLPFHAARQRLRPFRADHGAGARARARAGDGRRQAAHQRARESSRRTAISSSGEAPELRELLRRRRLQRLRHRVRRRRGLALAEWIAGGEPPFDLWPVDIRRFGRLHRDDAWVSDAHARSLWQALHHGLAATRRYESGRPLRRLAALRAAEGARGRRSARSSAGSGRTGSRRTGVEPKDVYTYGRQNWFDAVGGEHRAVREAAALFDQTSFAKFALIGRDAEARAVLDRGQRRGARAGQPHLHADAERARRHRMRPHRRAARRGQAYYIVTGTGFATHDLAWIGQQHSGRGSTPR